MTGSLVIEHKDPLLQTESLSSVMFLTVTILDLLQLSYLTYFVKYLCIPETMESNNANIWSEGYRDQKGTLDYVSLICSSEIMYQAFPFYFLKFLCMGFGMAYISVSRHYTRKLNRYDCIIDRVKIAKFIGVKAVRLDIDYEESFNRACRKGKHLKLILALCAWIMFIITLICQWGFVNIREVLWPDIIVCSTLKYGRISEELGMPFRCHATSEWEIFVTTLVSDFLKLVTYSLFFFSIVVLGRYQDKRNNMRKEVSSNPPSRDMIPLIP